jgi:hypothetical protein
MRGYRFERTGSRLPREPVTPGTTTCAVHERRSHPHQCGIPEPLPRERPRPRHRPPLGPGSGRNAKFLAPAGACRYARFMEISQILGNFPRMGVQVPPRTHKSVKSPRIRHRLNTQPGLRLTLVRLVPGRPGRFPRGGCRDLSAHHPRHPFVRSTVGADNSGGNSK